MTENQPNTESPQDAYEQEDPWYLIKLLAPYLSVTFIFSILVFVLILKYTPLGLSKPDMVTFDVIKYTNSQRAVASKFLNKNPEAISQANELLIDLPERSKKAIEKVAGPGTLVVIKQSVVQGQYKDITDEVLDLLKLPKNVPTSDSTQYVMDTYATDLMSQLGGKVPDFRFETSETPPVKEGELP